MNDQNCKLCHLNLSYIFFPPNWFFEFRLVWRQPVVKVHYHVDKGIDKPWKTSVINFDWVKIRLKLPKTKPWPMKEVKNYCIKKFKTNKNEKQKNDCEILKNYKVQRPLAKFLITVGSLKFILKSFWFYLRRT